MKRSIEHELLSERRFFGEFPGLPEVPANEVLPHDQTPQAYTARWSTADVRWEGADPTSSVAAASRK